MTKTLEKRQTHLPATKAGSSVDAPGGNKSVFEGFAGTTQGSFFRTPRWVDITRAPGTTSQAGEYGKNPRWFFLLSGTFLFYSPNLVWLLIALFVYVSFPYSISSYADLESAYERILFVRGPLNVLAVLLFFGFWHITLYVYPKYGNRPFNSSRPNTYRYQKVAHNVFYSVLGAVQWTLWEAAMLHCYAKKKLGYVSDEESFGTWVGLIRFVATFFWVPLWREVHFYFAHRLIHNRVLYKYVHSLHHRNTDIEPFSGLSMHPIEHLYYFSCIAPSLYVHASPFAFMWNGMHLLLSPAASHSGFEDNWQSDQFHYLHHRYFECNYGTSTFPFDRVFGTFRDRLKDTAAAAAATTSSLSSSSYKGSADTVDLKKAVETDAKATLLGFPSFDQLVFNVTTYVLGPLAVILCFAGQHRNHELPLVVATVADTLASVPNAAETFAATLAFGPIAIACALLLVTTRNVSKKGFRKTLLYPFHNERVLGSYGINTAISVLVAVLPVYHLAHTTLSPAGSSAYHAVQSAWASALG
eukprot:g2868.t1